MNDLPEGWTNPRLEEIALINPRHSRTLNPSLKVSFVPMPRLSETDWRLDVAEQRNLGDVIKGYTHFVDGDVLFAKITPCMENGKAAVATGLASGLGCGTTELHVIRPLDGIDPTYLYHFLHQERFRQEAALNFTGSAGQLRVPVSFIQQSRIPLAPLDEQRRIVAKLEVVLGKVEACQKRLTKIPLILRRFRQSVLASACSGRLTADWRNKNDGDWETNGHSRKVDEEVFGKLPNAWTWGSVESVCEHIVDCPHSTPVWTTTGFLCIRTSNFKAGLLDLKEVRYVSPETYHERIDRLTPRTGDVLYSREGAILGIACPVPSGIDLCLGQRMMLFRTKEDYSSSLLMHWLNGPLVLKRVRALTGGSASPHLNVRDIKSCPVPLPPRSEQQEIIRCVQTLFKTADLIETRYRIAGAQVDKLTQSILAKAFRGGLVPTEAELTRSEGCVRTRLNSSGSRTQGTCPAGPTKARRVARGVKQ